MAYVLKAFLAPHSTIDSVVTITGSIKKVRLSETLILIPIDKSIIQRLNLQINIVDDESETLINDKLLTILSQLSQNGLFGYVESEYWAGIGQQSVVVYDHGIKILNLFHKKDAINNALRCFGVPKNGFIDEFTSIGLDKHRSIEDWLNIAE